MTGWVNGRELAARQEQRGGWTEGGREARRAGRAEEAEGGGQVPTAGAGRARTCAGRTRRQPRPPRCRRCRPARSGARREPGGAGRGWARSPGGSRPAGGRARGNRGGGNCTQRAWAVPVTGTGGSGRGNCTHRARGVPVAGAGGPCTHRARGDRGGGLRTPVYVEEELPCVPGCPGKPRIGVWCAGHRRAPRGQCHWRGLAVNGGTGTGGVWGSRVTGGASQTPQRGVTARAGVSPAPLEGAARSACPSGAPAARAWPGGAGVTPGQEEPVSARVGTARLL